MNRIWLVPIVGFCFSTAPSFHLLRPAFATRDIGRPELYTIGVQLNDGDTGLVNAVLEGSPAESAGVLKGERITGVDGIPFESLLQWQRPGPMVVIVNGGPRSRKVALAHAFKRTGRAALIGTTTSGALAGGLRSFSDRDEGCIFYLSVQETRLDGRVIEGVGVSPDIVVPDDRNYAAPVSAALEHLSC